MKPTTESEVLSDIQRKYRGIGYAVLPQVQAEAGSGGGRILDCLLVSLHRSKGQSLTGIEIKISRSDWLRELKDLSKSQAFSTHCDYFYVAIPDPSIVKPGELPTGWGLMVCDGENVRTAIKATKHIVASYPLSFLCGILRAAAGIIAPRRDVERELALEWRTGYRKGRAEMTETVEMLRAEIKALKGRPECAARASETGTRS